MPESEYHSALATDLYELTMAAAYFDNQFAGKATFELFVRSLPRDRGFLIAAGLQQAIEYLESVRFRGEDIDYLRRQAVFQHVSEGFFEYLRNFRFTGEVWAVPEGTVMFAEEPLLRVTAPIAEAQVVETFLLSTLTFQTMIASKAARVAMAAKDRRVVEFGSRRAHGPESGVLAARAAYIGGCTGTSNVEAGRRYDVPVFGTLAHSFVMAYNEEEEAFRRFSQLFPEHSILLLDTYDTLEAVEKIIREGLRPRAVRVDSGNLLALSRQIRQRLDQAGLQQTQIFASGDLDEFAISDLLAAHAPIDGFGVGTALATSLDAPALGGVYKLVDLESETGVSYRAKFSEKKVTYPGRKQVYRSYQPDGIYRSDVIACESEKVQDGEPLLACVMRAGERAVQLPGASAIRARVLAEIARVPEECRVLHRPKKYSVSFSRHLRALLRKVRQEMQAKSGVPLALSH